MDDLVKFDGRKNFADSAGVAQVAVEKFERQAERFDFTKIAALDLRVVKIVQIVESPDAVAVAQKALADVRADEARAAGDEKIHAAKLILRAGSVERAGNPAFHPDFVCGYNTSVLGEIKNGLTGLTAAALLFAGCQSVFPRPMIAPGQPMKMKRSPTGTNSIPNAKWHTITITPDVRLPKIHIYDKLNPVWWLENADEPTPPAWYLPDDRHRAVKWRFRNPLHNFDHYVIGVADKKFSRSGKYPGRNSSPHGGWDVEIVRRRLALLPFVSYERSRCTFYFGWREHGAFGIELKLHHQP